MPHAGGVVIRPRQSQSGTAKIIVFNGYDHHTLVLSVRALTRILAGTAMTLKGQGFPVEGVMEMDFWALHFVGSGRIHVFTDTGREVFDGSFSDAEVAVVVPT